MQLYSRVLEKTIIGKHIFIIKSQKTNPVTVQKLIQLQTT